MTDVNAIRTSNIAEMVEYNLENRVITSNIAEMVEYNLQQRIMTSNILLMLEYQPKPTGRVLGPAIQSI